ncbi:hypothetical protein C3486_23995 [Streptomyces sp. Ru73]|uniref:hypothetical protein n=1 Tax=Streptomyces sp. Ru73 TaxID=2080748 RepID=UPI000CDDADE7|nr:hypothetical protein [Streptomyces sp. Ru73]POX38251.1 hypothetical protein C3486_23995 [Streptomyces sp. Ru73]
MHGPAPAPPPRPLQQGTAVLLRVVFVAVAVLSLGMLAWVTLLRAALVHRRPVAWWLFGVNAALTVPLLAVVGSVPESDWRGDAALALILLQLVGAVAYYLVIDIRARTRSLAAYGPGHARTTHPFGTPAYGAPAYGSTAIPGAPAGYPSGAMYEQQTMPSAPARPYASPQPPYAPPAPAPAPAPPQPHPRPQRIDQVRAELDELSDYLRRGDGHGGRAPQGEDGR